MPDNPGLDPDIAAHYAHDFERDHLTTWGRLEFVRTRELLARFLPPAPARILDVGGGTGVYALPLTEDGYEVHLVDAFEDHVRQAAATDPPLASAQVGDARDLPFENDSADAVLLLGPLYHLTERADRLQAWREANRVARPGAPVIAALISRFASTYAGLYQGLLREPGFEPIVERDVRDGQHRNPDVQGHPHWFATAYFHLPEEIQPEIEDAGLAHEALLAIEGPGGFLRDVDQWLDDPARRELLLSAIRRVEAAPSMLGASSHLLAVARAVG